MNPKDSRVWLVRTRSGDILGPYSQGELQEEFSRRAFDLSDEIAPSNSPWILADILALTTDEVTRTSTRTQTMTAVTATEPRYEAAVQKLKLVEPLNKNPISMWWPRRLAPFFFGSCIVAGIWLLAMQSKTPRYRSSSSTGIVPPSERETSPYLKTIYDQIGHGEYQQALDDLSHHHRAPSPSDYPEYLVPWAALSITQNQNTAQARKALTELTDSSNPGLRAKAHRWLGYFMLSTDEADMGENHFLEALQADPKDVASRFNLGRAYLKQERFSQSLDYLQLAELEMPDLWLIHIYKGRSRSELGQYAEAETSFRRAVELEPDRWLSYIYFALYLTSRQEKEAAEATLLRMILRDPQFEQVAPAPWGFFQERVNYGEYLSVFNHVMNENRSAEKTLGRLIIQSLNRTLAPSENKLISDLTKKGNRLAHLICLRRDLTENASHEIDSHLLALKGDIRDYGPFAYVTRAQASSARGDLASADADFKFALSLDPSMAIAGLTYAQFLAKHNRDAESTEQISRILSFHPRYLPAIRKAKEGRTSF